MSFDLFLERYEGGKSAPVDRDAVLAVLRAHTESPADKFGFYVVAFPDGSDVELSARDLESPGDFSGCAFHLRNFTPAVISFVYDIAKAGDMAIMNAQGGDDPSNPFMIACSAAQLEALPPAIAENAATCTSAEHLGELLGTGIEGWAAFRDSIVRAIRKDGS